MTPSAHLRAALEKYSKFLEACGYIDSDWWQEYADPIETFIAEEGAPILEAMEAYRGEAVDKLIAWADDLSALAIQLKSELAALKNSSAGKEK